MMLPNTRLALTLLLSVAAISIPPSASAAAKPVPVRGSAATSRTAPTQFVTAGGTRLAYRRFGKTGGVPVVLFQHFVGNLDNWDPKITDGLARTREVIIFDNAGVGRSEGEVPVTIDAMASRAIQMLEALGFRSADLFGFSTGSLIAQEVAYQRPDLARRLILAGSSPRGGVGMASLTPEFQAMLAKKRASPDDLLLEAFFIQTPASQAAGREFITRLHERTVDRDLDPNAKVAPAQAAALAAWGAPSAGQYDYLKKITQPVLIVDGSSDRVFYTANDFDLQQHLSNAELIVYAQSGHGAMYQYPDLFLRSAVGFLDKVE